MEIIVPSVGGRLELIFGTSERVVALKSRICDRTDIPKSIQKLYIEGTELRDADTLVAILPRNVSRPHRDAFL